MQNERSGLFEAVEKSNTKLLRRLLDSGCDPNSRRQDENSTPLLVYAVRKGCKHSATLLLGAGARVNDSNSQGMSAFLTAADKGDLDMLKLLECYNADVNAVNKDGVTAVMFATQWGKCECLQYLINRSVDVNLQDKAGMTALMKAAVHDRVDCLRRLVDVGADVHKTDHDKGHTALMHALAHRSFECGDILLDTSSEWLVNWVGKDGTTTALTLALKDWGEYSFVKRLLQRGARVSSFDQKYLHGMIVRDEKEIVRWMVINGCLPFDRRCWEGWFPVSHHHVPISPLAVALLSGRYDTARYFLVNKFLTKFDVTVLPNDQVIRQKMAEQRNDNAEALSILDALRCRPMPLKVLAFVTISDSKNTADNSTRRRRIENSGLPPSLQRELLFQTPAAKLGTRFWHDI